MRCEEERERERALLRRRLAEGERLGGFGSWQLDIPAQTMSWSDGIYRLLGMEPGAVAPSREEWRARVHPDDRSETERHLDEAIREGTARTARFRIVRADGATRIVAGSIEVTRDGRGRPVGVFGTIHDQTERVTAEARLQGAENRSRHLERMESLGQLAGGIAHDFNNLLAVILNSAAFAAEDLADRPETQQDIEEIRRAAERAADLTKRLLVFSRRDVVRLQAVDLRALLDEVRRLLDRLLGENVTIVTGVPPGLPDVKGDPGQLEQMLVNLAINARDAMRAGGTLCFEAEEVRVSSADDELGLAPGAYVCLRVIDDGQGMAPEVASHVFEPFFTTKPKGRGTGLGLATAYGAVAEAGGAISVASAPGEGTTFSIHLPIAEPAHDAAPGAGAGPATGADAGAVGGVILLVEDDDAVRRVADRILRSSGYDVVDAHCASAAVEALARLDGRVNLILTDLVMPDGSGWDLAEVVEQRWPGTPTVFMSGYTESIAHRDELVALGLPFLAKPFTAQDLLREVAANARVSRRG